jgi:hypothetical protein
MKDNKALALQESSGKEHIDGQTTQISKPREKNFRIPISNGIFEHYGRLKDARWLLDLFVDWTTKEIPAADGSRDGLVLGGKPIRDEDTARPFRGQCTARTTRRWRQRLARLGYIGQLRTPVGYVIRVRKSKKWAHLPATEVKSERPKMADHSKSELPNVADLTARNARSELPNVADPIKTVQGQNRDKAVEDAAAAAAFPPKGKSRIVPKEAWEAIGIEPSGSIQFCRMWERFYREADGDDYLVDIMERTIQECQGCGIRVPPPFFQAKRRVEKGQSNNEPDEISHVKNLGEESDEITRIPSGMRLPPPELMR